MNFVYILFNELTCKFYKGQTQDVELRLDRHNKGQSEYTSQSSGWQLLWCKEMKDRSSAMLLEKKIKNLSQQRLLIFMKKYESHIVDRELLQKIDQIINGVNKLKSRF